MKENIRILLDHEVQNIAGGCNCSGYVVPGLSTLASCNGSWNGTLKNGACGGGLFKLGEAINSDLCTTAVNDAASLMGVFCRNCDPSAVMPYVSWTACSSAASLAISGAVVLLGMAFHL